VRIIQKQAGWFQPTEKNICLGSVDAGVAPLSEPESITSRFNAALLGGL
jgi:hypothetical protein